MGLKPDEIAIGHWKIVVLPLAHFAVELSKCPTKEYLYKTFNYSNSLIK